MDKYSQFSKIFLYFFLTIHQYNAKLMVQFSSGDKAPDFTAHASNNPQFMFNSVAGRYVVLCFFGTLAPATHQQIVHYFTHTKRAFFDDKNACFFGVSVEAHNRTSLQQMLPGIRYFWDDDAAISRLYGALAPHDTGDNVPYYPFTLVLDPMLRVLAYLPFQTDAQQYIAQLNDTLDALPPALQHANVPVTAPILIVPRVFSPDFCRALIDLYQQHGGEESGCMQQVDGRTVGVFDDSVKRRKDFHFDALPHLLPLRQQINTHIQRRLVPMIKMAFCFDVTHIERYVVACYEGARQGAFKAHRDNTTTGTAHRRFACTINLNAHEYNGGDLRFPEFGVQTYRAPTGGAVIFSCSLLHEALPVTQGTRYAFLPFLYDAAAAQIRQQNANSIATQVIDRRASI